MKKKLREERDKCKASASAKAAATSGALQNQAAEDSTKPSAASDRTEGGAADGASAGAAEAAVAAEAGAVGAEAAREAAWDESASKEADNASPAVSPFACISATMGYSTFHMLQTLWLGVIDLPTNSSEKDWDLQARSRPAYVSAYSRSPDEDLTIPCGCASRTPRDARRRLSAASPTWSSYAQLSCRCDARPLPAAMSCCCSAWLTLSLLHRLSCAPAKRLML